MHLELNGLYTKIKDGQIIKIEKFCNDRPIYENGFMVDLEKYIWYRKRNKDFSFEPIEIISLKIFIEEFIFGEFDIKINDQYQRISDKKIFTIKNIVNNRYESEESFFVVLLEDPEYKISDLEFQKNYIKYKNKSNWFEHILY